MVRTAGRGNEFGMMDGDTTWRSWLAERISALVSDREIILRSDGRVRYFSLTRRAQLVIVGSWVAITLWVGFASVGLVLQGNLIVAKNQTIQRSQDSYRQLLDQVSDYQLSVVNITRDLKETQSHLRRLFDQNENLRQDLTTTETALRLTKDERDRMNNGRRALNDQFELVGRELRRMTSKNNALEAHIGSLRGHLESVQIEKAEIAAERAALDNRLWRLHNELAESRARREELQDTIMALRSDLRNVMIERSGIAAENDTLRTRVVALESNMSDEADQHKSQLEDIAARVLSNIQTVEAVLRRTGLQLEELAPAQETTLMGQGGPYIPFRGDAMLPDDEDGVLLDLKRRVVRWEQLRDLFTSVPLIAPIDRFRVTSTFGRRLDPLNGRWAVHEGLDLAGKYGAPIVSTAAGTVVYAGRRPRYGRVIDIDHGHGIMTRYAHLFKITVKRGQVVQVGDEIGLLGSSGRSTGPHVHFEVRYNEKPLNPRTFLKAVKYVRQQEGQ
jgi:murein DD-endopeptidase MepM/ murein hydrolase activator NlpD